MMSDDIGFQLGNVMVSTTQNKGHDPEFWAEQVTNKIVGISANAAPHVRQQAEAFRKTVYEVILHGMKNSIRSDRVTISNRLRDQGHERMANIIKEL
tara:strand:+ start:130 stop:420 length:291 start_codon:yes stop_codon:yes gene_type:complete